NSESEPFSPSNWRSKLVFSLRSLEFISSSSLRSFSSFSNASCAFLAFSSSACNEAISPSILPPFTSGIGFSISTVSPIINHPRRKTRGYNRSLLTSRRYRKREALNTRVNMCGYTRARLLPLCKNIYNRSDTTFQEGKSREGKEQLMSLKNCCNFSLVKLMQSCSKPLNCEISR
ncbi:hypothetical protein ALC57_11514, partial [Trachymyrmex cornetzi]